MFRLIESSSGQSSNHVLGTSSKSAHFWGVPKTWFKNWPDDDFYESKNVATFMIDNK